MTRGSGEEVLKGKLLVSCEYHMQRCEVKSSNSPPSKLLKTKLTPPLKANYLHPSSSFDMPHALSEDDIYRTSTQYRLWSFSPESLASLRKKTHDLAIERGRRYVGQNGVGNGEVNGHSDGDQIEFLTEEEELRLVQRYCDQIRSTSDHFKWPINVKVHISSNPSSTPQSRANRKCYRRQQYSTSSASTSVTLV